MFKVMLRMLRRQNEATPKSNSLKKWVNKSIFKIKFENRDVLKWIAILSMQGLTWAAKNESSIAIHLIRAPCMWNFSIKSMWKLKSPHPKIINVFQSDLIFSLWKASFCLRRGRLSMLCMNKFDQRKTTDLNF